MKAPQQTARSWFQIQAKTADDPAEEESTEVLIYGVIGDSWWEESVSAAAFRREFSAITTPRIDVHVHSPGGGVWDGLAIANTIRQSKAHVVVTVDGLAASAASFIAIAGDELVMAPGSELMIHDGIVVSIGNPADLRETADWLDRECDNIAALYARKAGGEPAAWRDLMRAETWYTAAEAVVAGLADRVDGEQADAGVQNRWDLSFFNYAGRDQAPPPALNPVAHMLPAESPGGPNPTQKEEDPMADLITGLRERLGIKPEAALDDDGLLAALDEVLAEQATEQATSTNQLPDGVAMIDSTQLAQLRADAAAGRDARSQQVSERRERLVDAAIEDGRIPSARREHWLAQLAADEDGATAVLNQLEKNTIPVATRGHTGGTDGDDLYNLYFPKEA